METEVFISYSHRDEHWRQLVERFLASLRYTQLEMKQLGPGALEEHRRFVYKAWTDHDIEIGTPWEENLLAAIERARVAIMLISTDFLASTYILERETPKISEREGEGELAIFPVLVRPCLWKETMWLEQLQIFVPEKALSELTEPQCESALYELMIRIDAQLESEGTSEVAADQEAAAPEVEVEVEVEAGKTTELRYGQEFYTALGVRNLVAERANEPLRHEPLLLFRTKKQCTWLAATSSELYCVLDGEKTRHRGRAIQWCEKLAEITTVRARERSSSKFSGLVDVGSRRRNWLYSKRLHPNPRALEARVRALLAP